MHLKDEIRKIYLKYGTGIVSIMVVFVLLSTSVFVVYGTENVYKIGLRYNPFINTNENSKLAFKKEDYTHGPTYVLLVYGYNGTTNGTSNYVPWTAGNNNIYQQLVRSGYIVGLVLYYGNFTIKFSNGYIYKNDSNYNTVNTPIQEIGMEFGSAIQYTFRDMNISADIVSYSMGGLVTVYMLEHWDFTNIYIKNLIFIATPFDGTPLSSLSSFFNVDTSYESNEMIPHSSFLNDLKKGYNIVKKYYPEATVSVYAGNYDPWWGYIIFTGNNDGVVSDYSAEYFGYSYLYIFPDLHVTSIDYLTLCGVSYFQDQNVTSELLLNLKGIYPANNGHNLSMKLYVKATPAYGAAPLLVNFSMIIAGGNAPFHYKWYFGNGNISYNQNPYYLYQKPGKYNAYVVVTDGSGSVVHQPITILVNSVPVMPLSVSTHASVITGTAPLKVNFTANISGGIGPYSYDWYFGNGYISNYTNTAFTYLIPGNYTATFVVEDGAGNISYARINLTVNRKMYSNFKMKNIIINTTSYDIFVKWNTNIAANSSVSVGASSESYNYGNFNGVDFVNGTLHEVTIGGAIPGTTYYLILYSTTNNNITISNGPFTVIVKNSTPLPLNGTVINGTLDYTGDGAYYIVNVTASEIKNYDLLKIYEKNENTSNSSFISNLYEGFGFWPSSSYYFNMANGPDAYLSFYIFTYGLYYILIYAAQSYGQFTITARLGN